ncbi:MAG: sigma-54 dependent transcriptional regulator [Acidobacteriia bacterium]|nr:sigma-54 dependent transcriptional regulator [Terriglobia bacterium]
MADILVVDDDQSIATAFQHFLSYEGHECRLASSAQEAIRLVDERRPDLVMMDVRMPGVDGLQALEQLRSRFPGLCVVIMTAYGTSQTSIDAIRAGAFDYITKPLDLDELRAVISKALASQRVSETAAALDKEAPAISLIGETPAMLDVYKMIGRLATNSVPALVVGERGTGKHLIVATVHDSSARRDRGCVRIDSGSVSPADLDTALFRPGAGTLELTHVERLSAPLQAKIAHALAASRSKGSGPRLTSRVLATTEQDLAGEVAAGRFSRELYDELAIITIHVPPLRERRPDIPLLVRYFVQLCNEELDRAIRGVDDQVARRFQDHPWPGNVGELERVIKRACIVARSDVISMDDLGESLSDSRFPGRPDVDSALGRAVRTALHDRLVQSPASVSVYHDVVDLVETTLVSEALTITNGNQVKAAEILGVNRATLRKKMPADE